MKITWIRHGQTDQNLKGTYYGKTESSLTPKGKNQIKRLQKALVRNGLLNKESKLYCSPQQRAVQTAQLLTTKERILDPSLEERNMGLFEGLTYEEIKNQYPIACQEWEKDWKQYQIPQGESAKEQYDRVEAFMKQLEEKGEDAIVITHSGVIRMALCKILGGNLDHFWHFRVEPGQMVMTHYEEGNWFITHLGEAAETAFEEEEQEESRDAAAEEKGSITLVTGGCRSGKSLFAEKLLEKEEVLYLATAKVTDEEMEERVKRHQKRRNKNWATYEGYKGLGEVVENSEKSFFLLDCITILTSNFMFEKEVPFEDLSEEKREEVLGQIIEEIDELLKAVRKTNKTLVMVTNEVGSGIVPSYALGRIYRDYIGIINQHIAKKAETVYEVKCGIPVLLKGSPRE